MEIFVTGVNRIRKIKGLTQAQLANKIPGGKRGTVSSWLRGRTKLPEERMNDFSVALNTPIEEIVKIGREEQSREKKVPQKIQPDMKLSISKETLLSAFEEIMLRGGVSRTEIEEFKQASIDKESRISNSANITTERHRQVIEKFRQKDLALKLNEVLLEIERINPESLESALEALDLVKIKAEREAAKKRTANGEE